MVAADVLKFWFEDLSPKQWFAKSDQFDVDLRRRFGALHTAAARNELFAWRSSGDGRLAEILVLDQFSRNLYRDQARAFSQDAQALALAQAAIAAGDDERLSPKHASFLYLPYMHSESPLIHEIALKLFARPGLEDNLRFERAHKEIIDRFGRYPHRNMALGRASTPGELEFMATHAGF